jgi:hypothetical protein
VLAALAVAAVVGMGWWGYREARQLERGFKDPAAQAAKTRAIVSYQELPAGYHPLGAFSVPLLMDMAMFSDKEPPADEEEQKFDKRGFLYLSIRDLGENEVDLRRFLRGEGKEPEALAKAQVDFAPRETVAKGALAAGGGKLLYQARRGSLRTREGRVEGIATIFLVDCPQDDGRLRLGIWFGPDPAPTTAAPEANWTGTPADPAALREFAGHFKLCG